MLWVVSLIWNIRLFRASKNSRCSWLSLPFVMSNKTFLLLSILQIIFWLHFLRKKQRWGRKVPDLSGDASELNDLKEFVFAQRLTNYAWYCQNSFGNIYIIFQYFCLDKEWYFYFLFIFRKTLHYLKRLNISQIETLYTERYTINFFKSHHRFSSLTRLI